MMRIKIQLPEKFHYECSIPVLISDINYGNHLGNDSIISMINEARLRFFKELGFTDFDIGGVSVAMRSTAIKYSSQAFHGDTLKVEVALTDYKSVDFELTYKISKENDGEEVARVVTNMFCGDAEKQTIVNVPDVFIQKIQSL